MSDIDWLKVNTAVTESGVVYSHFTPEEKKMALRRLTHKMNHTPSAYAAGITTEEAARRLSTSDRSVQRILAELAAGEKNNCPKCSEYMWVVDGIIEPHPNRLLIECEMSNREMLRGLAAIRPDLYRWLEVAS